MSKWWTIRNWKDPGGRSLMSIAKSTDGKQSFLKDLTSKSPIHQIIFPLIFIADSSRFYLRKVEKEEKEAETYD